MTYAELYSIIRRTVTGNRPNSDDNFNDKLINRLVLSARAFILMKYTNSGRSFQNTLVQTINNVYLTPVQPSQFSGAGLSAKDTVVNKENTRNYIRDLYYYTLPSEFLQWGNRRAIVGITDIDNHIHCAITERNSINANGHPIFKTAIFPIAFVDRKNLFVRVKDTSKTLAAISDALGDYVQDKENYPTGTDLVSLNQIGDTVPMRAKFVNISGVFYDPIAVGAATAAGVRQPDDLSATEINIPYEFVDMLVEQVKIAYLESIKNTPQENKLEGRTENQPLEDPI